MCEAMPPGALLERECLCVGPREWGEHCLIEAHVVHVGDADSDGDVHGSVCARDHGRIASAGYDGRDAPGIWSGCDFDAILGELGEAHQDGGWCAHDADWEFHRFSFLFVARAVCVHRRARHVFPPLPLLLEFE